MKNHILESIFETAANLANIEGTAAIEQLLIEAASRFPEVESNGFSFQNTPFEGRSLTRYFLHTKLSNPWPLEFKGFCGSGRTPKEAFVSLINEMDSWFNCLNCEAIMNHGSEDVTEHFLSDEHPDLRTEYAA